MADIGDMAILIHSNDNKNNVVFLYQIYQTIYIRVTIKILYALMLTSREYMARVLYISNMTHIIYTFSTVLRLISAICPSEYFRSSIVAGSRFRFSYLSLTLLYYIIYIITFYYISWGTGSDLMVILSLNNVFKERATLNCKTCLIIGHDLLKNCHTCRI